MTSIGRWLLALTAIGQVATSSPPAFPRPNATKLVETDRLVVWDIVWPKDQPSPLHRHVFDQVGTYYQSGGRAITSLNGARSEATTPVGISRRHGREPRTSKRAQPTRRCERSLLK